MKMKTLLTLLGLTFAATTPAAYAQGATGYPDKPIRLVVPFTAGGALDVVARLLGQKLTDA